MKFPEITGRAKQACKGEVFQDYGVRIHPLENLWVAQRDWDGEVLARTPVLKWWARDQRAMRACGPFRDRDQAWLFLIQTNRGS